MSLSFFDADNKDNSMTQSGLIRPFFINPNHQPGVELLKPFTIVKTPSEQGELIKPFYVNSEFFSKRVEDMKTHLNEFSYPLPQSAIETCTKKCGVLTEYPAQHSSVGTYINEVPIVTAGVFDASAIDQYSKLLASQELINRFLNAACDDSGNVDRFEILYPQAVLFSPSNNIFYVWDGRRWASDKLLIVETMVEKSMVIFRQLANDARFQINENIVEYSKICCNNARLNALTSMLKKRRVIDCVNLDIQSHLFNVWNGTVDLPSSKILSHQKCNYISRLCNVEFDPSLDYTQSLFYRFLGSICNWSQNLMVYLQTLFGYAITGETREQCFFILYGNGSNGKSVLLEAISRVVGDICWHLPIQNLVGGVDSKGGGKANPDLVGASTARMVFSSEPERGDYFNESAIKLLTGESSITTRQLFGKSFEFVPKFKIFLDCNYLPKFRGNDYGLERRIKVIPFQVTFTGDSVDKNLSSKLRQPMEQQAILAWLIQGAKAYYSNGLSDAPEVSDATNLYLRTVNTVGAFVSDCLITYEGAKCAASHMYTAYRLYCEHQTLDPVSETYFGSAMIKEGAIKKRTSSGMVYLGLAMKSNFDMQAM